MGSYLYGSVVTGDYEPTVSDVDTVCVLRAALSEAETMGLEALHRDLVREAPEWDDRLEVVYLPAAALQGFRTTASPAARISPGEPFHAITVDHRWLMDWYQLRRSGLALSGPPASSLVPPIARADFIAAVRDHMLSWQDWVAKYDTRGSQAYAILTMCRGLRACRTGEHVSKREAARWACVALPGHAPLIRRALAWRQESGGGSLDDGTATSGETRRFVEAVARLVT